ncbi:MAG TPA: type II toxin-antitoxin system mRNA interferase toxin, RelE/StbE family [Coleofasciculaceae cyanobacterium]
MKPLVFSPSFKRAFKATIKRRPELKSKIEDRLRILAAEPFDPVLRTHKLKGQLAGSWACTVEYDCRIVFDFVENGETGLEEILLIDIGSHDEVY